MRQLQRVAGRKEVIIEINSSMFDPRAVELKMAGILRTTRGEVCLKMIFRAMDRAENAGVCKSIQDYAVGTTCPTPVLCLMGKTRCR